MPTRRGDWWYYGRSFEGKQYGVQCRCPVARSRRLDAAGTRREHRRSPASRCCSTRTSRPRATSSSRSARRRSASTATCWRTRSTSSATSDTRCGSRTYAPVSCTTTTSSGIGAGCDVGGRQPHRLLRRRSTTRGVRTPSGATASARVCPPRRCFHEPDERFWLGVGRTRSDKYVIIARGQLGHHARCSTPTPPTRTPSSPAILPRRERRRVLRRARRRRWRGPIPDPAQRRRGELHPRRGAGQRSRPRSAPSSRTATTSGSTAVDAFDGHLVVSYRSEALPRIQLWPIYADGKYGAPEEIDVRHRS